MNDANLTENKDGTVYIIFGRQLKDGTFQVAHSQKSRTVANMTTALKLQATWRVHGQE